MDNINSLILQDVLDLCKEGKNDDALDVVYTYVDDLAWKDQFDIIDDLLLHVDVTKNPLTILLGFLTITMPVKESLTNRELFYSRVYAKFAVTELDPQKLFAMFTGLR